MKPTSLLELYSRCSGSDELRRLFGTYADLTRAQNIAFSHLQLLGYGTMLSPLADHLAAVEEFAVNHLKLAIALHEHEDDPEDEPA